MIGRASNPVCDALREPWILKLKAAYDAGYYKTEAAAEEQTRMPWQNPTPWARIYEQRMPREDRIYPLQKCLAWLGLLVSSYSLPPT